MKPVLPSANDAPDTWRTFALAHVTDALTRRAVLAAMHTAPDAVRTDVLASLLPHARGQARLDVAARIAALAPTHPPTGALVYALVGEALASSGATRTPCIEALRAARADEIPGIALALAASAEVPGLRERNERERAAWALFRADLSLDPFERTDPADALHTWRRGEPAPAALDHALLLATAGAPRATAEHLRSLAVHVITRRDRATPPAARLLAWLARACTRPDAAPASMRHPAWFPTAVDALARTTHSEAGTLVALRHAAARLAGDRVDRALALAIVRRAILDARRAPGEASAALTDALAPLIESLAASPDGDDVSRDLIALLLGRDRDGSLLGAARWLSEDLRARVLETALAHPLLAARTVALDDLERHGVPASVVPLLRDIATSDLDPVTRQHARQLARGEHL